jgi:competence/damage-inducible protein CinA-like protein
MTSRAGIVVTGTEVLTGRVTDRNGPWLAEQLRVAGVDVAQVVVVGDRPDDMRAALQFFADTGVDLIITSGGLGPTADDMTAQIVADFQGRTLELDTALEQRIAAIIERIRSRGTWRMGDAAAAAGTRKQALVPSGAAVLEPTGTAPGLVVPAADGHPGPPVLVLPGPPREVQGMWSAGLADQVVRSALAGAQEVRQHTILLWGTPEAELAATLRENSSLLTDLEVTTCLRDGELEIVTRYAPAAQDDYDALHRLLVQTYADTAFSPDGETVDAIVARLLLDRGLTVATAESCTGGLLAGRLTELAGSSAYVVGALTVYSNEAKHRLAGVSTELLDRVGAVSAEVARALADGARQQVGTDVGVGITGIAGPGGATAGKPVGLVYLCASDGARTVERRIVSPGDRGDVRRRAVLVAMHMLRELLA